MWGGNSGTSYWKWNIATDSIIDAAIYYKVSSEDNITIGLTEEEKINQEAEDKIWKIENDNWKRKRKIFYGIKITIQTKVSINDIISILRVLRWIIFV